MSKQVVLHPLAKRFSIPIATQGSPILCIDFADAHTAKHLAQRLLYVAGAATVLLYLVFVAHAATALRQESEPVAAIAMKLVATIHKQYDCFNDDRSHNR